MATQTRRETIDLIAQILAEPKNFSLGQVLRLLGYFHAKTPEELQAFLEANVSIRPWLSLAFPSTEITDIRRDADKHFAITSTSFGLYSTMGPLPTLYTEELLEEARNDESVSRDFLDILNNHLAHLRYAAHQHHRLEYRSIEQASRGMRHLQFCLMGQAQAELDDKELPRVHLTEILARKTRSAAQLEKYLSYILDRSDVRIEQCVERIASIPRDQRCRLGQANASLGEDCVLGQCLCDSTGRFRIHLMAVEPEMMRTFLPKQPGHTELARHLQRFLYAPLDYELCLHPATHKQPVRPLGQDSAMGFYLGTPKTCLPVRVFWKEAQSA